MLVKIFSRSTIKQQQQQDGEYYICINSAGGSDSEIIFEDSLRVKNFWFDDTLFDTVKWGPDIQDYYPAIAITYEQGFELYEFIKKIPQDAVVNVYCSKGSSRSGAVGQFLKEEYGAELIAENNLKPNERVFNYLYNAKYKFIQPIGFKYNQEELVEYYQTIEKNFQDLKWTVNPDEVRDSDKHKVDGFFGWAIQSNLEDLERPCPPYDVHKEGSKIYRNTRMVFGFAKKLLERFPYGRQMGIAAHPPGVSVGQHIDNEEYVKIHFPIYTNNNSYFSFGEYRYVFEPGRAYLINTRYMHGTDNQGDSIRIHLLLKLPYTMMDDVLR